MKRLCLILLLALISGCAPLYVDSETRAEIPPFVPKGPVRVALVLGGGGSKGFAHLGAIQELEAAGIRPDLIIGCSAGAIAGALYADQPDLRETPEAFLSLKKADLLDYTFLRPLFGLVEGQSLQNYMHKTLHAKNFEELQIPLILVATDLVTGDVVELCHGDISRAVRASCAYPGLFKPVLLYDRYLVDGGAASPIPISVARKYGAEIVIAIDLSEKLPKASPRHLFGVTKRSLEIAYRKFVEQSLSQADIVIKMDFDEVGTFTDHLNEYFYKYGRETVQKQLPEIVHRLEEQKDLR
jgi:NTE family protein